MPVAHPSGALTSAPEPHTRHPGSAATGNESQVCARASCTSSRPTSASPVPVTSLTASVAMTDPTLAHTAPRTPPTAQEGTASGGGCCGNTQA